MATNKEIRVYLPASQKNAFEKLCKNVEKNVEGFSYEIGNIYTKTFMHKHENGGFEAMWHEICNVKIIVPEINNWSLLVTYKDGNMFVVDRSKELVFSNPNHGKDYKKCDICGHKLAKRSYVIVNSKTGEELQVGCNCVKKFGLDKMNCISAFTAELYSICVEGGDITSEEPLWTSSYKDLFAVTSIKTSDLLKAAKTYYDKFDGLWIKSCYRNDEYIPSESSKEIQKLVSQNRTCVDDKYIDEVKSYTQDLIANSEFGENMKRVASDYYSRPIDAVYAFFMVKNYEDHLTSMSLKDLQVGQQVKVTGHIIKIFTEESFYGTTTSYEIKTSKGYTVIRKGTIHFKEIDGKKLVDFYALVRYTKNNRYWLDRALKNPKKGLEVVEI